MSIGYSSTRRYVFAREFYRSRRQRAKCCNHRGRADTGRRDGNKRPTIYHALSLADVALDKIISPENLLLVSERLRREGGQAPGSDGLRYCDFSKTEMAAVLRHVSQAIRDGRYRPHPTRHIRLPKPSGRGYRELCLPTIVDRIVAGAVSEALTLAFDVIFGEHVHGFRSGRGVWTMLRAMEEAMRETNSWYVYEGDIRNCFPSVRIDLTLAAYRAYIADPSVLDLIERILRGYEGQRHEVRLDQGNPLSPLSLNVLLHHWLDRPLSAGEHHPLPFRYADNIGIVSRSASEGRRTMRETQQRLEDAELDLKGEDGPPSNLRREGAQTEILGTTLSKVDNVIRVLPGENAWAKLSHSLQRAHGAPHPAKRAEEAVRGWLNALAGTFECAEIGENLKRVCRVASRLGFREMLSRRNELERHLQRDIHRWQRQRDEVIEGR